MYCAVIIGNGNDDCILALNHFHNNTTTVKQLYLLQDKTYSIDKILPACIYGYATRKLKDKPINHNRKRLTDAIFSDNNI